MENENIKKKIAIGNTNINVVLEKGAQENLMRYIEEQIKDPLKTKKEKEFLKIICDMINQKQINFLNLKIQFTYGKA